MVRSSGWVLVAAVLVAACSGSGPDSSETTGDTSSVPTTSPAAAESDAPSGSSVDPTSSTLVVTTTTVESPPTTSVPQPVRIEDTIVDPRTVLRLSDHQRGLLPPGDDPSPGRDPGSPAEPDGPCAFAWTDESGPDSIVSSASNRLLSVSACEFDTEADAVAYANRRRAELDPEALRDGLDRRERFELG